jgi:hypothetical protein
LSSSAISVDAYADDRGEAESHEQLLLTLLTLLCAPGE